MARGAGSGKTPRQAPDAASPGSDIDRQAKPPRLALPADLGRSLPPVGRRPARPPGGGGGRRGPAARTECAGPADRGGPVAKAHFGEGGARKAGQACHGHRGTETIDPRRFRCRSQARGDREGVPGLAVGSAACHYRRETRPPQDGAIDGPGPQAEGHALEVERG